MSSEPAMRVPFFRPEVGAAEIAEVTAVLQSGWLTTGPRTKTFETDFAAAVGGRYALALNSCTAALHLALDALGVKAGDGVLVPTETFAATAEVVRYLGAIPILVDCDPATLNLDLADAERKLADLRAGRLPATIPTSTPVVGIIPVHVGGLMVDLDAVHAFAKAHGLWVVEDSAHAFPAARRSSASAPWRRSGQDSSRVACFSFYANKTITTGEGGMAVTDDEALMSRMRLMALHGLSHDAWNRYSGGKSWDYRIVAPGYKYNMTDMASAVGIHQLARAEQMRLGREAVARQFHAAFAHQRWMDLPADDANAIHSWHLFPVRLNLAALKIDRNAVFDLLRERGVACSVHWRPLHLHPYYQETFGWKPEHCPVGTATFDRLLSLPIYSGLKPAEIEHVIRTVLGTLEEHSR
jgi:dTDP-4-amino-4,6-dideoxygalactose transaminase